MGQQPVDPCLSRQVFQGHPAGVPRILLLCLCAFYFLNNSSRLIMYVRYGLGPHGMQHANLQAPASSVPVPVHMSSQASGLGT